MSDPIAVLSQVRLTLSPETRERQMAAIHDEIRRRRRPRFSRRRLLVVAFAILLAVPVMALAAEDTVPGDFLYPVKRLFEPVVAVFDRDVIPTHRVDEVEDLIRADAPIDVVSDRVEEARHAVREWPVLERRLDRVIDGYHFDHRPRQQPVDHSETTHATDRPTEDTTFREPLGATSTTLGEEGGDPPPVTQGDGERSRD